MKASELKVGERYAVNGDRERPFGQMQVEVVALGVDGRAAAGTYTGAKVRAELSAVVGGEVRKVADVKSGVLVRYQNGTGAVLTPAQFRMTWAELEQWKAEYFEAQRRRDAARTARADRASELVRRARAAGVSAYTTSTGVQVSLEQFERLLDAYAATNVEVAA